MVTISTITFSLYQMQERGFDEVSDLQYSTHTNKIKGLNIDCIRNI